MGDVVTTSSAFLTDKEEVLLLLLLLLLQYLTFFSAFLKSKEHVYTTQPLKKPASQPASQPSQLSLIVFSHCGPTQKKCKEERRWVGGWKDGMGWVSGSNVK